MQEQLARSMNAQANLQQAAKALEGHTSMPRFDVDLPQIAPRPEPQLLRDLITSQDAQLKVLQSLVNLQTAEAAAGDRRDARAHHLSRASLVAATEAAVLTVAFGSGAAQSLPPVSLVGIGAGAVGLVVAVWVDWRSAWRRLRDRFSRSTASPRS